MPKQVSLILFLLAAILLSPTHVSALADIFKWEANLEAQSGVASSLERSVLKVPSDYWIPEGIVRKVSKEMVASWSSFICLGGVTLGIFETKLDESSGNSSLHFRYVPGFSILTFGSVKDFGNGQWDIPIRPSWLARQDPKQNDNYGCLRFRIQRQNREKAFLVESRIMGYRPWLVGSAPVSPIRKFLYLSTQSKMHAYITWRFHRQWHHNLLLQGQEVSDS